MDEGRTLELNQTEVLARLRDPFPDNQISKLPKPTKAQSDAVKESYKTGKRCELCGGWHHPDVVHLDYVGHAALTDRLLDVDPLWFWMPLAYDQDGLPKYDKDGGLWIQLHILGMVRLGYGHANGTIGKDATKEIIGDALRNAAMRYGAALDLWHKGDLHAHYDESEAESSFILLAKEEFDMCESEDALRHAFITYWSKAKDSYNMKVQKRLIEIKDARKALLDTGGNQP